MFVCGKNTKQTIIYMKTLIRRVCCYFSLTVCVHIVHFKKPPHSCSVRSMHCCGMKQKQSQSESAALTFCLQQAANQKAKVQEWKYRAGNGKNISNSKTQPSCHSCFYYHQAEPQACGHWHEHSCRFTHTHTYAHLCPSSMIQWRVPPLKQLCCNPFISMAGCLS